MSIFERLAAPFPADAVHWRAQSVNRDGNAAMALAYIDARDVMDRLDEVCGPDGWSDSYVETAKGRVVASISIDCGEAGWISKSDGAGDTDVEGDKGGISDAFKRAAVKWGIGRYLYRMDAVWADCESYEKNGKKHWSKWTPSGLKKIQAAAGSTTVQSFITDDQRDMIATLASVAGVALGAICGGYKVKDLRDIPADQFDKIIKRLSHKIQEAAQQKEAA